MPTFSYREKNDTISVRCGARCRAYHASSMGEGKGPPHNCAPARFLFFGFFNSMESAFPYEESFSVRPNPVRRRLCWRRPPRKALFLRPEAPRHLVRLSLRRLGRGASPSAKPCSSARRHHVLRPERTFLRPDVVPHPPQSLISSFGSTTSIGRSEPPATRTWCLTPRKPLFLRLEAPRPQARTDFPPGRRGASPSANPCSSVWRHHVLRPERTLLRVDVVPHPLQTLFPPCGGTTSPGFPFPIRRECDEYI